MDNVPSVYARETAILVSKLHVFRVHNFRARSFSSHTLLFRTIVRLGIDRRGLCWKSNVLPTSWCGGCSRMHR
jgi:hypothetical protein